MFAVTTNYVTITDLMYLFISKTYKEKIKTHIDW